MTPQEKVNNKSNTYRQFLNDQEQQLLAKGLKVVNKDNNTYGLAPIGKGGEKTEMSSDMQGLGVDNAFIKVHLPKKAVQPRPKMPTRIILPNLSGGNQNQSIIVQSPDGIQKQNSNLFSGQKIIIKSNAEPSNPNRIISNNGNQSILQAALTGNSNASNTIVTNTVQDNGNIIVLNKGVASSAPVQTSNFVPQQQILLLPGINGGPARLILLQPNNSMVKLEPAETGSSGSNAIVPPPKPMTVIPKSIINQPTVMKSIVKKEILDTEETIVAGEKIEDSSNIEDILGSVKTELNEEPALEIMMPKMIKLEPID